MLLSAYAYREPDEASNISEEWNTLMADVKVRFDGSDADTAGLARIALQPVLNAVYREYVGRPQNEIEAVLQRVGRDCFARDRIKVFAHYSAAGDRPLITDGAEGRSETEVMHWFRARRIR